MSMYSSITSSPAVGAIDATATSDGEGGRAPARRGEAAERNSGED